MEIFIAEQLKTLVESIILGLIFGVGYDIIRVVYVILGIASYCGNKKIQKNKFAFVIFLLLDSIFMLFVTTSYSIFLYHSNNGMFRLYLLLTCIGGFVLYYNTFGRLVMRLSETIVMIIKKIVNFTIIRPGKIIFGCLRFFIVRIGHNTIGKVVNILYIKNRQQYMKKAEKQLSVYIKLE